MTDQIPETGPETSHETSHEASRETSRRNFLLTGWKLGGALLIGAGVYTGYEALRPLTTAATGGTLNVGNVSNFAEGTSTYIGVGRMYVVNVNNTVSGLLALSQKCPHLGCKVPFCDSSGRFECACHGSIYDLGGEWIQGPAPHGMDRYAVKLDKDNNVIVDTSKLTTGPDRGAKQFLTPPKGPSCLGKS